MEFPTPATQAAYEKVTPMIKEIFGEFARPFTDRPAFSVSIGSAYVIISVSPWGDDNAVVRTLSYVVTGIEMTPELMRYLLKENSELRFGAFGVDADDDIMLHHSIAASA